MKIQLLKRILLFLSVVGLILIIFFNLNPFFKLVDPALEPFTEIYLLGPNKMMNNYPYHIELNNNYTVYVGVINHLSSCAYYALDVIVKNQIIHDYVSNVTQYNPVLYQNKFIIGDNEKWEYSFSFSINKVTVINQICIINEIIVNNVTYDTEIPVFWDNNLSSFSFEFLFQLMIYNTHTESFEYNNNYVNLKLTLM